MTIPEAELPGVKASCDICGAPRANDLEITGGICPRCARLLDWFAERMQTPLDLQKAHDPAYHELVAADSLDILDLLGELNEQFGVEFPSHPGQFKTVADWIRYINLHGRAVSR